MTRRPYYPGAEVWKHPDAEATFTSINEMRAVCYKAEPLDREKTSTQDVLRERLKYADASRRQLARWMAANAAKADA